MFKKLFLNKITIVIFSVISLCAFFCLFKKHSFTKNVSLAQNCAVEVKATLLDKKSFSSLFHGSNFFWNRDVCKRYKAVKIDVKNESEHNLVLDRNGIMLSLINPLVIQKKLSSTFNIIPLAAGGAASALCSFGFGLATLPTMLISGGIGTAAGFLKFDKSEEKLGQNIHKFSYDPVNAILIPKQNMISKIFFIENKSLKPDFDIKLFDLNLEKYLDFNVKIN